MSILIFYRMHSMGSRNLAFGFWLKSLRQQEYPKKIPYILIYSNLTAFVGSVLSILMVKKISLEKVILFSVTLLAVKLLALYLTFSSSANWVKALHFYLFLFSYSVLLLQWAALLLSTLYKPLHPQVVNFSFELCLAILVCNLLEVLFMEV